MVTSKLTNNWWLKEDIMVMPILSKEEFEERRDAAVSRFRGGDITESEFRVLWAGLRFPPSEISAKIEEILREKDEYA